MSDKAFKITIVVMVFVFVSVVGFMIWDSGILSDDSGNDVSVSDTPPDAATFDEYFLSRFGATPCEDYIEAIKVNTFDKLIITTTDTYAAGEIVDYNPESCTFTLDDESTISMSILYDPLSYDLPNTYSATDIKYTFTNTENGCSTEGNVGSVKNLNLNISYSDFDCSSFDEASFKTVFDSVSKVFDDIYKETNSFRRY